MTAALRKAAVKIKNHRQHLHDAAVVSFCSRQIPGRISYPACISKHFDAYL
nr:MAG TPA_asm: RuvC endonuclease subdomain 3 [Bacteriophage sp.]